MVNWKHMMVGDYDWGYLCTPQWPWCNKAGKRNPPRFFDKDAWLGLCTAAVMGLQHAMAMLAGLTTVPYLLGANAFSDPSLTAQEATTMQQYLISATLIVCGITSAIQVTGIPLPFKRQLGAGILSVMGVSFATFSPANGTLGLLIKDGNTFEEAFGKVLGTAAVCAVVPFFISFLPPRVIKRVFPPIVCGVTICLIGINLCGVGMKSWGGGAFCADNYKGLYLPATGCSYVDMKTNATVTSESCFRNVPIKCNGNGDVVLPFGSPVYVGLGFAVFGFIVLLELFGSPFMRNCEFVTSAEIDNAPAITFLWVHTFPLKIYGPLVLPLLIIFCITSIETVGDVTATEEASFLSTTGPGHEKRIRGALLNDGISSIFSALATSLPLTTFAQNNGVISLTAVASRQAGWACAIWLFLMGVLAKFGGIITSIPDCVFGGMTTFLFANVIASGVKIIVGEHLSRRNRIIMAFSFALGIGVTLVPQWANNPLGLWPYSGTNETVRGIREAVITILDTGFCIGAITAIFLNLLLPAEEAMVVPQPTFRGNVSAEPSFLRVEDFNATDAVDVAPTGEEMTKFDTADNSGSGKPAGAIASTV
ncbi:Uric acid-xanthine permease [Micractinium conductrix]|uniref:Uric acid-xanthine permease n=1 Tax=Micractinium conductrix TaxID=554055 RepID=A0A2P6VGE6_9CHLO|nr:Uric acid-xanthine permease [Micractinium conductrix]|eukprot:PSC73164.1 Uric acid-xanthine permease [Micractinium conductrix]